MEVADVVAEKSTDKAEDLNNTIKEIISDIDREIGYQENVGTELLQQKDSPHIENDTQRTNKQQTQHSTDKNNLENSELQQRNENTIPNQLLPVSQPHTEGGRVLEETNSKSEVLEETSRTENGTLLSKKCNIEESSTISKEIDLQKILTPAQDVDEILPKNRKLYASSAFYSPDLHPTVEDQVELARRISHSLSDISNQQSKGQSMYVNRMKSSVKWVHEGPGKENSGPLLYGCNDGEESKENTDFVNERSKSMTTAGSECTSLPKVRLKLVMNPRGQIRDFNSVRDTWDTGTGLMSPDKCAELVNALNAQKGKGAELFAKRRRKAEKWVVDETNAGIQSPSGVPDYHQYQPTLPANTDAGKRRVEQNFHQEPLNEKSVSLGLKTPSISQYMDNYKAPLTRCIAQTQSPQQDPLKSSQQLLKPSSGYNCKRDLAYRPNIPQGWKAENFTLPKELYIPKEIPLESYAPPPTMATSLYDKSAQPLQNGLYSRSPAHLSTATPMRFPASESAFSQLQSYQTNASLAQDQSCGQQTQYHDSFPTTTNSMVGARNLTSHPPKQLHLAPNSYQTVPQETSHVPPLSFNPSQLRYDKLAKFENPSSPSSDGPSCRHSSYRTVSMPAAEPRMRKHSPVPKFYNNMADQSSPLAHQQSCHHAPLGHHFNSTKLLRCQNFNNAARGWNPSGQAISRNNDVVVVAGNLPYTDF